MDAHDEFIFLCEDFINGFEQLLPNETNRPHGRYEQAVQYAFDRIEDLNHVERVSINGQYTFLVSVANEMAIYTRCVRQECKSKTQFCYLTFE